MGTNNVSGSLIHTTNKTGDRWTYFCWQYRVSDLVAIDRKVQAKHPLIKIWVDK